MTCPDFKTSSHGRAGIGVVQPQSGLDYPLVAPSSDIQYLIADLHLAYDDDGEYNSAIAPAAHPLRIKYLYGAGCIENARPSNFIQPTHEADIVIVDAHDRVILDTTPQSVFFNIQPWGNDYKIYEWKTARAICRMVLYTTWPDDDNNKTDSDTRRNYNKYLTPKNAQLDERAIYKIPRRLLSMRVRNGQTTTARYNGNIKFTNGYNTEIVAGNSVTKNFRNLTAVNLSAAPGSGLGRYENCSDIPAAPISKINGVPSINGDFRLSSTDCLWVRRPITTSASAAYSINPSKTAHQQIGADCTPCCSCSDYSDTAKYMNETSYRYKLIGQRADKVRAEHENNIARWLDKRACSVQRPLRLFMVPQRCPYMDIVMMLCNPCETCTPPTLLTVTFDISGDFIPADSAKQNGVAVRPTLECGYTTLYAPGIRGGGVGLSVSGDGLQYSAALPQLKPNESAYVQFRLKFNQYDLNTLNSRETKARGPYIVTGVLTGTYLNTNQPIVINCGKDLGDNLPPPPAAAETTQTLHCNSDGMTEAPC